jgi:hypothetical protein
MIHKKDRYGKESHCPKCDIWVPSVKSIFEKYGWIVAVKQPLEYPKVYDNNGNSYQLQNLIPIRQVNRRGQDGTLFEEIREFRVSTYCPNCKKQMRSGSYSKTPAKNHYISSWRGRGRPKHGTEIKTNEEIEKEQIDQIVHMIKISKGHIQEIGLEDVKPHLLDKVKKRLEKKNAKRQTSHVT